MLPMNVGNECWVALKRLMGWTTPAYGIRCAKG
jgi:hypothetical protein